MSTPKGIITAIEAKELNDNWTTLRAKENEVAAGQPDNRSSWYSIEDMQIFLNLIKEDNPSVNGVRFYLGVETTKETPKGLTTIFMVPTVKVDNENKDISEARAMDRGENGHPPEAQYPQ